MFGMSHPGQMMGGLPPDWALRLDFDHMSVLPSAITYSGGANGGYWDSAGVWQVSGTDEIRFHHDPVTLDPLGPLFEEEGEKLALRSEELNVNGSGSPWTHTRVTVTANAIAAPDGKTTADELVEDGTEGATHYIQQTISFVATNVYALSVFAKKNTRNNIRITFTAAAFPNGAYAVFDFDTGTFVSKGDGADSASITDIGGGWYRASLVATADATTSASAHIYLHNGSSITYDGDGSSGLYLWGAQVEAGAFPTSYVKTTGAAVTRTADVATMAASIGSARTILVKARTAPGTGTQVLWQLDDGTTDNLIKIERQTSNLHAIVRAAAGEVADLDLGAVGSGTDFKVCFRIKANNFGASLDGGAMVTDTGGAMPTGIDTRRLGHNESSADFWNSTIALGQEWNKGLSDLTCRNLAA